MFFTHKPQGDMNIYSFNDLALCPQIQRAITESGYQMPTEIQQQAIPKLLQGHDLLATAQTGTGKTAAFALPILQRLSECQLENHSAIKVLVLTPTRELALQIDESFKRYGRYLKLGTTVILGGVSYTNQIRSLRKRPQIVIATPGRLLDLLEQGELCLNQVGMFVLDEADRMLDMGFAPDIRRILALLSAKRQTMLFSATISPEIAELASSMLSSPERIQVTPSASISTNIAQKVLFVDQDQKRELLSSVLRDASVRRALVFTRTKHRADRIMRQLSNEGISSDAIHSNKSQNARVRTLTAFSRGRIKVLVATDIASRGIDVDGISHVINFEIPHDPESYVHRIGRTARAGASGTALSLCDATEVSLLRGIEKLTNCPIVAFEDHPYHSSAVAQLRERKTGAPKRGRFQKPKRGFRPRGRSGTSHRAATR